MTDWLDPLGSVASAACAVHCFVLMVAPAVVALLGLEFLANEAFEWGFFVAAVALAVGAAGIGYASHRTPWVVASFGVGLLVLVAGRLGEAWQLFEGGGLVAVLGGGLLVASHLASRRQVRVCRTDCAPASGPGQAR